jgi:hypothetical protein
MFRRSIRNRIRCNRFRRLTDVPLNFECSGVYGGLIKLCDNPPGISGFAGVCQANVLSRLVRRVTSPKSQNFANFPALTALSHHADPLADIPSANSVSSPVRALQWNMNKTIAVSGTSRISKLLGCRDVNVG